MKFYLYSDLHLEFTYLLLPGDKDGVLLLAGDIMTPAVLKPNRTDARARSLRPKFQQFLAEECAKYKKVYWIAGNHEFYHGDWETTRGLMREAAQGTNVTVLEKDWLELEDGLHLFAATLWTDFYGANAWAMSAARRNMNDYNLIEKDGRVLEPPDVLEDHYNAKQALLQGLDDRRGTKILVMTHHAPSQMSEHPRYKDDILNWAYFSDLNQLILDYPSIKYWVHGHTHDSHDYHIGGTRVICNARGYDTGRRPENALFNSQLSFEL